MERYGLPRTETSPTECFCSGEFLGVLCESSAAFACEYTCHLSKRTNRNTSSVSTGKSTMAHCIIGLQGYTDFEGDILFEEQSFKGVPGDERARRGITLDWQEPACFEGLSMGKPSI